MAGLCAAKFQPLAGVGGVTFESFASGVVAGGAAPGLPPGDVAGAWAAGVCAASAGGATGGGVVPGAWAPGVVGGASACAYTGLLVVLVKQQTSNSVAKKRYPSARATKVVVMTYPLSATKAFVTY